jgi:hypothetical protein
LTVNLCQFVGGLARDRAGHRAVGLATGVVGAVLYLILGLFTAGAMFII